MTRREMKLGSRASTSGRPWYAWVVFIGIGVSMAVIAGCECIVNEAYRVRSPNGKLEAVVFYDGCGGGATTDDWTKVALVETDSEPRLARGNVVIVDHSTGIRVEWMDEAHLHITMRNPESARRAREKVKGVLITYSDFPDVDGAVAESVIKPK